MSLPGLFLHFGLKQLFDVSARELSGWIDERFSDSSRKMPQAILIANQRAWQVVGLAVTERTFGGWVRETLRDGDLKAARDQIRHVMETTPTGDDISPSELRQRAATELERLQREHPALPTADATLRRYSEPAALAEEAARAVAALADEIQASAPYLARVLRLAPGGGHAIFPAMYQHFLRRIIAKDEELSRGLTHDQLRNLASDMGERLVGVLDQFDVLFDDLARWFAATDEKLDAIRTKLDKLLSDRNVTTSTRDPLTVSVTNEKELAQLRHWRDELRRLPPELLASADWGKLGDALAAGRLFAEASEAHEAAAKTAPDRAAEAEAKFKAYRDASEQEQWDTALKALIRAAELDPARFTPFPLNRYEPIEILGAGGFGTVIKCRQRLAKGREVAVKTFHAADLERDVNELFAEAHTLTALMHPGIVRVITWDYADPADTRPYVVMEYFPGVSLATHLKRHGRMSVEDFLSVAVPVAKAMAAAHGSNILHRDIKPGNVLVQRTGDGWQSCLIDFGLAVRFESVQASASTARPHRTRRDRSFAGTAEYASPEQKGLIEGEVGPRSDVFSFGKTMLEALLGTADPVSEDWEVVPDGYRDQLRRILERCIIRDPSRRHPGFEPIVNGLSGLSPTRQARPEPPRTEAPEPTRSPEKPAATVVATPRVPVETPRNEILEPFSSTLAPGLTTPRDHEGTPPMTAEEALRAGLLPQPTRITEVPREIHPPEPPREEPPPATRPDWLVAPFSAKAAKAGQRNWAEYLGVPIEQSFVIGSVEPGFFGRRLGASPKPIEMQFSFIPPGTFTMGSDTGEEEERPAHQVTLTKGFFLGVHPVTQKQWDAVMGSGTAPVKFKGADRPVDYVAWEHCRVFCRRLTSHLGLQGKALFRLPTEAEWEYACRAGTDTDYHTGDGPEALKRAGWFKGNSDEQTQPVGQKAPNAWNLQDMHGNVWEWVSDWKGDYRREHQEDPVGPGSGSYRVLRGGSWAFSAKRCRSAVRNWFEPAGVGGSAGQSGANSTDPNDDIGFRIAMVLQTSYADFAGTLSPG